MKIITEAESEGAENRMSSKLLHIYIKILIRFFKCLVYKNSDSIVNLIFKII